jgi:hypothetical protein
MYNLTVPKEGIEPSFPKERDFESRASAYSATSAHSERKYTTLNDKVKNETRNNWSPPIR